MSGRRLRHPASFCALNLYLPVPPDNTTFQEVFNRWRWKSIRNCPGRYVFAEGVSSLKVGEIAACHFPVFEFVSKIARDRVLVMKFKDGGGIISYRKDDGRFLHTLNDADGLTRKLDQLQIKIQPQPDFID